MSCRLPWFCYSWQMHPREMVRVAVRQNLIRYTNSANFFWEGSLYGDKNQLHIPFSSQLLYGWLRESKMLLNNVEVSPIWAILILWLAVVSVHLAVKIMSFLWPLYCQDCRTQPLSSTMAPFSTVSRTILGENHRLLSCHSGIPRRAAHWYIWVSLEVR